MNMKYICPLITVSDIQRSRKFYEEILQQKVKYDFGENITFHGDFAIHLDQHFEGLIDPHKVTKGGNNFELYFELDRIDEKVELLKEHQVEFVHELREQPWRQKVVRFYDLDRNIIELGESMEFLSYRLSKEGLSVEEICRITNMPEGFVDNAIQAFGLWD